MTFEYVCTDTASQICYLLPLTYEAPYMIFALNTRGPEHNFNL
jgi:hypothetical protein